MQVFSLMDFKLEGSNLIEASAGTGKTYTISALFLRLILEKGLKVNEVLVVTFTRAATAELKQRLRNALVMAHRYNQTKACSDATLQALFEKALACDWVETIMFPYNLVETQGEDLMRQCTEKNIGFIVMKPLAGGAIEDPTLALRFICANPDATIVIPGMYDVKEIDQNLAAASDSAPLTDAEWAKIEAIRKDLGSNFCRRCNYCQPCTKGIGISAIFILQGYYDRYGLQDWAKGRYDALPVKASACIDCGVCEPRCPYNLPIREMLKDAASKFEA